MLKIVSFAKSENSGDTLKIGDRVTFPASPASSTRYVGTIIEINNSLARIEVEGYGGNHISAVRIGALKIASRSDLSPMDAWNGES